MLEIPYFVKKFEDENEHHKIVFMVIFRLTVRRILPLRTLQCKEPKNQTLSHIKMINRSLDLTGDTVVVHLINISWVVRHLVIVWNHLSTGSL